MKKLLIIALTSSLFLTACGEKNEEYYLSNIDKAQAKLEVCEADMMKAMMSQDESAAQKLAEDKECNYAIKAVQEHKRLIREAEIKKAEAEKEAALSLLREKTAKEYTGLTWQDSIKKYSQSECSKSSFFRSDECGVEHEFYLSALEKGKAELGELGFMKLKDEFDTYCSKDARQFSECTVWQEAVKEQGNNYLNQLTLEELVDNHANYCPPSQRGAFSLNRHPACEVLNNVNIQKTKDRVKELVDNHELLKEQYNDCVDKIEILVARTGRTYGDEYNQLSNSVQCSLAQKARNELRLTHDNFKTKM